MADERELDAPAAPRSRLAVAAWLVVTLGVLVAVGWYATHPPSLPISADPVEAESPVGQSVYVGIWSPSVEAPRHITLSAVEVEAPADDAPPVRSAGLVCKGGSVSVTDDPMTFCTRLLEADGATLTPGDVLVLELLSEQPGTVELGRVTVSYRDGLQWGTQEVGGPVVATFVTR